MPITPRLPILAAIAEQRFAEPIALERDVLGTIEKLAEKLGTLLERRLILLTLEGDGLEAWSECVAGVDTSSLETVDSAWGALTDALLGPPRFFSDFRTVSVPKSEKNAGQPRVASW